MELVSLIGTIHYQHSIVSPCQLCRFQMCKKGHGCDSQHPFHSYISSQILEVNEEGLGLDFGWTDIQFFSLFKHWKYFVKKLQYLVLLQQ